MWQPFQLRPDTPLEGVPLSSILPAEYLAQAEARLKQVTAEAGLPYKRHALVPNTHLAHEAGMAADAAGLGDEFHRAVLRQYFGNAGWIGGVDELVALGDQVGMLGNELREALTSGRYRERVDAAIAEAYGEGVAAVPAFIFGPGAVLSGAQPYEVFEKVMAALGVPKREAA